MHPRLLGAMRCAVAAIWLYEGLWLKILRPAPHELAVVASLPLGPLSPAAFLRLFGTGETLLGLAVLSGRFARPLAWIQGALLLAMNGTAVLFAGPALADPFGLLLRNLPLLLCIVALGIHGPGRLLDVRPGSSP